MSYQIAEVFGYNAAAGKPPHNIYARRWCPFADRQCNKSVQNGEPLAVCSIRAADGSGKPIPTCPQRFLESGDVFLWAADLAFNFSSLSGVSLAKRDEVPFTRDPVSGKKSSSFDYVIMLLDKANRIQDYCALETQAVYFSGTAIRSEYAEFLRTGKVPLPRGARRPDYRSSSFKRLMPQLNLKVETLTRWGKKLFVAIDTEFFSALNIRNFASDIENADIIWLVYEIKGEISDRTYKLSRVEAKMSTLRETQNAVLYSGLPTKSTFENNLLSGQWSILFTR